MKTLALIPARAGSKGVPNKNIRLFRGEPLVAHALRVALLTCDRVCVSSDDMRVHMIAAATAERAGNVDCLDRPAELAQDDTPMFDVVRDAVANYAWLDLDVVVLLQPSSPTSNRADHVRAALRLLAGSEATAVVSVSPIPAHMSPDYAVHLVDGRWVAPATRATRRQDCRPAYYRDGTVYAIRRWVIEEGDLYGSMPAPLIIPAAQSCTIDTEADWLAAEAKHAEVR